MVMNRDEMRGRAHRICRDYLHGAWQQISADDIVIKPISGGLSNALFLCELPHQQTPVADEPRRVLLRMYGQAHEDGYASVTESVIFTLLAERRLGPRLYGVFPGGRLEEYIQASSLPVGDLRDTETSQEIARNMAMVHSLQVPICKEPTLIWQTMDKWIQMSRGCLSETTPPQHSAQADIIATLRLRDFPAEVTWLRRYLQRVPSPVLFCHNDCQEGNLLRHTAGPRRLTLIDYEYCSYNYRGFDFANHFCEWMYDYTAPQHPFFVELEDGWPSRQQQLRFVRAYLRHRDGSRTSGAQAEECRMLDEIHVYALASHLFWTLWSIVNAPVSTIAFGYWEYAKCRLRAYQTLKQDLLRTDPRCPPTATPASTVIEGAAVPSERRPVHA